MSGNMDEGAMKRQYAKELAAEMFARRQGIVPRRKPPDQEAKLRWARVRVWLAKDLLWASASESLKL